MKSSHFFAKTAQPERRSALGAVSYGAILTVTTLILTACFGDPSSEVSGVGAAGQITGCNDTIRTAFHPATEATTHHPVAETTVTLVREFKKGEVVTLTPDAPAERGGLPTPIADNDVCVVKLLIGPGHPGPADAPSTSAGIGIEIWLPAPENWNGRVHALGGGGCSRESDNVVNLTKLAGVRSSTAGYSPAGIATGEGAVSAMTDTGHTVGDCSFAMNPDGSINTPGMEDFATRAIHEEILKAKALAEAYYGSAPRYTYFDGFSTGGRQAMMLAQSFPDDLDGILGGAPAMNSNIFSVAAVYPTIVYERDLGGVALTGGQRTLMGNAAINACDVVGGVHSGYILDPSTCIYDPTQDPAVLCVADGGTNSTADCVTPLQAQAQNKIWYGMTADGSVPSPAVDNGWSFPLQPGQYWWGHSRGSNDGTAGGSPFGVQSDKLALLTGDPSLAGTSFLNATGNGEEGYRQLSYAELAEIAELVEVMEPQLAYAETNNTDLTALQNSGTKVIHYHGLADNLITAQGSIDYYRRAAEQMGGVESLQNYYRFYLVPSMSHGFGNGSTNREANPPLPTHDQLYEALTNWVENGIAPGRMDVFSEVTETSPTAKSAPICLYPQKATYSSGDPNLASSYSCS